MTQDRLDRIEALLERFIITSDERMTCLEKEIGDLRTSLSSLRDIVVGHERKMLRLEGRDIDL